jgi:formate-dependent phosphoribosylglycinamide formyltransferase (GAR transformylase)
MSKKKLIGPKIQKKTQKIIIMKVINTKVTITKVTVTKMSRERKLCLPFLFEQKDDFYPQTQKI